MVESHESVPPPGPAGGIARDGFQDAHISPASDVPSSLYQGAPLGLLLNDRERAHSTSPAANRLIE
ncbi:MAG: hypothetical protein RDA78_13755 [Roseibium sp.]|uniref:hypothetical protein n=1 Tax=Roseibium sp. TaxID=1936156 RepID=UPI003D9C2F22